MEVRRLLIVIIPIFILFGYSAFSKTTEEAKTELKQMNINYTESEFLYHTKAGDTTVVSLFLDAGMSPNTKDQYGWTVLMYTIWGLGHAIPPNPEEKGRIIGTSTSIPPEITRRYTATVKLLIQKGADVNAKTSNGKTAMWVASYFCDSEIVQLLKDAGAKDTYVISTDGVVDFMRSPYYFRPDRGKALQELYSMKIEYSKSAFLK